MLRAPIICYTCIAALALAACSDTGTRAYSPTVVPEKKIAFPGKPVTVYYFYSLHPDCTQAGSVLVEVIKRPRNGAVLVEHNVQHFPEYPLTNARYRCSTQKVASEAVTYTAPPGFTGTDFFSVR